MKKKIYKIMGVALVVVLLASLTVGLAVPAAADPGKLKWTDVTLPKVEDFTPGDHDEFVDSEGDFWAAPLTDVGPIAVSPDGDTLFAAVSTGPYRDPQDYPYRADWYDVLKSTDGGYSWAATGFYEEWDAEDWNPPGDPIGSRIVDIVVSPDYEEDSTVLVATEWSVYQSVDGGKRFACMDDDPDWWDNDQRILDLDVALDDRGRLAIMVGTCDRWYPGDGSGEVYVMATATGMAWEPQGIDDDDEDMDDNDLDVLAVGFSPFFADDEGIVALVTGYAPGPDDEVTMVRFSFGYIGEDDPWNGWNADIMDAYVKDAEGFHFESQHGRIAFPDDFDAWGVGNNVLFAGIYSDEGWSDLYPYDGEYDAEDVEGDVYKIVCKEAGTSSAIDLDIRGIITTLLPTATDIVSIDVCGDAEDANIVVGLDYCDMTATPEQFLVYHSEDGGETWMPAVKAPTGGMSQGNDLQYQRAMTTVVMAPDYCDSGIAYASTWGLFTSAFHRTSDAAESWNQISIVDYGDPGDPPGDPTEGYAVVDLDAAGYNAADTLRMTTMFNNYFGAVWERTGGKNWERVFSYANPGVTQEIEELIISGEALFAVDYEMGWIWRSSDNGATWPKKISTKADLSEVVIVSPTNIYTGHGNGEVWWSTKSGVGWTKPDDSEIPDTAIPYMVVVGDKVLIGSLDGAVFVSSDGGETIEKLGLTNPGDAGDVALPQQDLGFADNNIIYCTLAEGPGGSVAGAGVWRTEVDWDDPSSSEWEQIDDNQDSTGAVVYNEGSVDATSPAIALPPSGVLYVTDGAAVVDDDVAGGLWRCTNPTADVDGLVPPYFEKENKGLDTDDRLGLFDLDVFPTVYFCAVWNLTTAIPYYEQVVMFTDTLDSGVTLAMPAEDATGVGLLPTGYVKPDVIFAWESMAGANSYELQVAVDPDFKTRIGDFFWDGLSYEVRGMYPNATYYWRVRVADEGSLIGAPLISPWSATWKFKTAIGASMARPDLEAPWSGEPDVPLDPTFEWSGIEWAEVYDFELATDPATTAGGYFTAPLKALIGTEALVSTAWKCDIALDYETRYYWHVKAFGVDTETPWSDVGTFTTMSVPPEPVEPGPPIVVPPQEVITPAWIWAIVIIGAILVIAVIVLIVTTRRVP